MRLLVNWTRYLGFGVLVIYLFDYLFLSLCFPSDLHYLFVVFVKITIKIFINAAAYYIVSIMYFRDKKDKKRTLSTIE
jgi:hypothetical protein